MSMYVVRTVHEGVGGAPLYSNLWFRASASPTAQDPHDAVTQFWTAIAARMTDALTWEVLGEVYQIDIASGDILGIHAVPATNGAGSSAGDPLPWATQGLLQFRTSQIVASRRLRGRLFLPGVHELDNDDGRPLGGYGPLIVAAAEDMRVGTNHVQVVYSPTHRQAGDVTAVTVWSEWASLRSRRD